MKAISAAINLLAFSQVFGSKLGSSELEELNEVLALTSQLAQLQTRVTLAHENFPWYTILEMEDEDED